MPVDRRLMFMKAGSNKKQAKIGLLKEHTLLKGYAEIIDLCDMRIALLQSEIDYCETTSAMFETRSALEGVSRGWRSTLKSKAVKEMANARAHIVMLNEFLRVKDESMKRFEDAIGKYPEKWKTAMRKRYLEMKGYGKIQEEMGLSSEEYAPIKRRMKRMEGKDGQKTQHES